MKLIKYLIISVLLCSAFQVQAQNDVNEYRHIWEYESNHDTVRMEALRNYYRLKFLSYKNDSIHFYAMQLDDHATNKHYPIFIAKSFYDKAQYYKNIGEDAKALKNYKESLIYYRIANRPRVTLDVLNEVTNFLMGRNLNTYAIEFAYEMIEIAENTNSTAKLARAYGSLGMILSDIDSEEAKYFLKKAIVLYSSKTSDSAGLSLNLINLAMRFIADGQYDSAIGYTRENLNLNKRIKKSDGLVWSYQQMGYLFTQLNVLDSAFQYYRNGINLGEQLDGLDYLDKALAGMGNLQILRKQFRDAIDKCDRSFRLSETQGNLEVRQEACWCLYQANLGAGNSDEALEYLKIFVEGDSISQAASTLVKTQEMQFNKMLVRDSIQRENDARIRQENEKAAVQKRKRNWAIASVSGLFLIMSLGFMYARLKLLRRSSAAIAKERDRSEQLLLNILPEEIAEELKEKGEAEARDHSMATILFTDFKEFTKQAAVLEAHELVGVINVYFKAFDLICERYNIEKIKTIGDSYMAAGGIPVSDSAVVKNTVLAALEMQEFIKERKIASEQSGVTAFEMRVGIHTGPVVAGIVGVKKFQYDIWGDTVNLASRMESNGEVGKVNITRTTYDLLKADPEFKFESRGKIQAKGKGEVEMYFVSKA